MVKFVINQNLAMVISSDNCRFFLILIRSEGSKKYKDE
jgi:hypothetical protein